MIFPKNANIVGPNLAMFECSYVIFPQQGRVEVKKYYFLSMELEFLHAAQWYKPLTEVGHEIRV